jgi:hypothetical protein
VSEEPWFAGTLTLGAVIVGAVIGVIISEIPLAVAAAMSVGAGSEIWLQKRGMG